jgi:hypothetical protein
MASMSSRHKKDEEKKEMMAKFKMSYLEEVICLKIAFHIVIMDM